MIDADRAAVDRARNALIEDSGRRPWLDEGLLDVYEAAITAYVLEHNPAVRALREAANNLTSAFNDALNRRAGDGEIMDIMDGEVDLLGAALAAFPAPAAEENDL